MTAWEKDTSGRVVSKLLIVAGLGVFVPSLKGIQKVDLEMGWVPFDELFPFIFKFY